MMHKFANQSFLIMAVSGSLLLVSCSEAKFSGQSPTRATDQQGQPPLPIDPEDVQLACVVTPTEINPGDKAVISVSATGGTPDLFQKIAGEETTLVFKGGVYLRNDEKPNEIRPAEEGTFTVEIRRSAEAESPAATCNLTVRKAAEPKKPKDPDIKETEDTATPCKPSEQSIGAHIAFLIDNSNSNAATDCPDSVRTGEFQGVDVYECRGETNREKAVRAAHDLLAAVAAKEPGNAGAVSSLALASFPSAADYVNGYSIVSKDWLTASASGGDAVMAAMSFVRKPSGLTPYGAAINAATELFGKLPADDGKARVAVLVTDGEPTDSDPAAVSERAAQLRAAGVKVITVFVTGNELRTARVSRHNAMMKNIDDSQVSRTGHHWFNESRYQDFASYLSELTGTEDAGKAGLVTMVSSKSNDSCKDTAAGACERQIVEVSDSAGLKDAFLSIIKTKAIGCEQ